MSGLIKDCFRFIGYSCGIPRQEKNVCVGLNLIFTRKQFYLHRVHQGDQLLTKGVKAYVQDAG